jgi:hypothetical protein
MKKNALQAILSIILAAVSTVSYAALVDNGGGFIYDSDLNITWYDYNPGAMEWGQAMSWASGLNAGGVTEWRLPQSRSLNYIFYDQCQLLLYQMGYQP